MQKTARFRSAGANGLIAGCLLLLALIATRPACADDYSDGIAAFEARDYVAAALSWQKAAEVGSADAYMALGLLADLGLGLPREPDLAFGYYMEAAKLGIPAAAFNVGVMLDSGNGAPQDRSAASIWYARAALSGSVRAAYNLGLLYRDGTGVPENHDLASYWLGTAAASLPAAEEAALRLSGASMRSMAAPLPLSGDILTRDGSISADLVWTAEPGPERSSFAVQMIADPDGAPTARQFKVQDTPASALQVPVPEGGFLWRVARIDPATSRYVASGWLRGGAEEAVPGPVGLVTIVVADRDPRAAALADNLALALQDSGLIIRIMPVAEPVAASTISYRYETDLGLASDLAAFLPGFTPQNVILASDLAAGPGEVVITLALDRSVAITP